MTDNTITINEPVKSNLELQQPESSSDFAVFRSGLRKQRGIKRNLPEAQNRQIKILFYLYDHPSLTVPQIKKMWGLSNITIYRQMSQLKHAGLIIWKGSHKNGGYRISDKGKVFLEQKGRIEEQNSA